MHLAGQSLASMHASRVHKNLECSIKHTCQTCVISWQLAWAVNFCVCARSNAANFLWYVSSCAVVLSQGLHMIGDQTIEIVQVCAPARLC